MDTAGVTTPADYANDAADWIPYGLINIANALTVDTIATFDFANADLVTAIGEYKTLLSNDKVSKTYTDYGIRTYSNYMLAFITIRIVTVI